MTTGLAAARLLRFVWTDHDERPLAKVLASSCVSLRPVSTKLQQGICTAMCSASKIGTGICCDDTQHTRDRDLGCRLTASCGKSQQTFCGTRATVMLPDKRRSNQHCAQGAIESGAQSQSESLSVYKGLREHSIRSRQDVHGQCGEDVRHRSFSHCGRAQGSVRRSCKSRLCHLTSSHLSL